MRLREGKQPAHSHTEGSKLPQPMFCYANVCNNQGNSNRRVCKFKGYGVQAGSIHRRGWGCSRGCKLRGMQNSMSRFMKFHQKLKSGNVFKILRLSQLGISTTVLEKRVGPAPVWELYPPSQMLLCTLWLVSPQLFLLECSWGEQSPQIHYPLGQLCPHERKRPVSCRHAVCFSCLLWTHRRVLLTFTLRVSRMIGHGI